MKSLFSLIISLILFNTSYSQWTDFNPGITGDFSDIEITGSINVLCGNTGIFSSPDMINWTQDEILINSYDSTIFEQTIFYGLTWANNRTYACGKDTVNNTGVIFCSHVNGNPSGSWSLDFSASTPFNDINSDGNKIYVVGDSGAIYYKNSFTTPYVWNSYSTGIKNLKTIDVVNSYRVMISGDSILLLNNVSPNQFIWDSIGNNGIMNDIANKNGTFYCVENTQLSKFNNYNNWENIDNINISLNMTGIETVDYRGYIGTADGIYKTDNVVNQPWEYQPSSSGNDIQEIVGLNDWAWAVGNNSTMITTTNKGGLTIPYVEFISPLGSCLDSSVTFLNNSHSLYTSEWYVDDVFESNSFDYTHIFTSIGTHIIKLVVNNGIYSDSIIKTIEILLPPNNTLPFEVSDTIICKYEEAIFTIHNSEVDVYYSLYSIDFGTLTNFELGNGGDLLLSTGIIPDSTNYIIYSRRLFSDCISYFSDTIFISIDHTKANFHIGVINAVPGENVNLYAQCNYASSFLWNFPLGTSILSSINPNETVSFTDIGNPIIELICMSENNCYDTIQKLGTTIFQAPNNFDSCWVNLNEGTDPGWPGTYYPHISSMTETINGYLISGKRYNENFATQYGDSMYINNYGGYINQYDYNGILKWSVKSKDADNAPHLSIKSTTGDGNGNIYACGYLQGYLIDNKGDSINFPVDNGVILKLDSLGKIIWYRSCSSIGPIEVSVDYNNQVYVSYSGGGYSKILFLNDSTTDTITSLNDQNYGILKLNENGEFIWDIPIFIDAINQSDIVEIQFDGNNNIYVASIIEQGATLYTVDNLNGTYVPGIVGNYGGKTLIFKLNTNGELQWTMRSRTVGVPNDSTYPMDMESDENGNLYVSGRNNCYAENAGIEHIFENTDGSITSSEVGEFFIAKINSSGICQWIRGAHNSYYGYGEQIDLVNDTLYVVGSLSENNSELVAVEFRNPNGSLVSLEISRYNYFISEYDTSGNVLKVIKNAGNVNGTPFSRYGASGFFKNQNSFYIATNGYTSNYTEFGTIMGPTNGREGWVTKAEEGCGIVFYEMYETTLDTTICQGSDYVSSTGTVIYDVQINTSDTIIYNSLINIDSLVITNIEVETNPIESSVVNNNGILTSNELVTDTTYYQWVNCDQNFEIIQGETNQSLIVTQNGNFAVEISIGSCSIISDCVLIDYIEIITNDNGSITFYPNPVNDILFINFQYNDTRIIETYTIEGELIELINNSSTNNYKINVEDYSKGTYIVKVKGTEINVFKFVKN